MKDKIKDKAMGLIEKVANKIRPEQEPEPKWSEKLMSASSKCFESKGDKYKYRNPTFEENNRDAVGGLITGLAGIALAEAALVAKGVEYVHENMQEDRAGEEKEQ